MLSFLYIFPLNWEAKRIDYVADYTQVNHIYYKNLPLIIFSFFNNFLLTKKYRNNWHRKKGHIWQIVICHWHILKTRVATKWNLGVHHMFRMHLWHLSKFTVCFEKPIAYNFCKSTSLSIVSKAFWKCIRIMQVITPLLKPFTILSIM